jgi:TRAP-type C4-dicarboxylate transport system permease small subunit
MTEWAMALIVFLGVGLVTHQRGHIVVDVLTLRLSERSRVWLGLVTNLLSLGFVLVMVWRLWLQAGFIASKGDTTPILNVPLWPIAYLIAAGSVFLATGLILHVLDSLDRATHPEKSAPEAAERPFQD